MSMTVHFTGTLHDQIKRIKQERGVGIEALVRKAVELVLDDPQLLQRAVELSRRDGNRGVGRVESEGE